LTGKRQIRLRIIDDTELDALTDSILQLIKDTKITYYDAYGVLEIVKAELLLGYTSEDEDDD
jgi:hypothetical protein